MGRRARQDVTSTAGHVTGPSATSAGRWSMAYIENIKSREGPSHEECSYRPSVLVYIYASFRRTSTARGREYEEALGNALREATKHHSRRLRLQIDGPPIYLLRDPGCSCDARSWSRSASSVKTRIRGLPPENGPFPTATASMRPAVHEGSLRISSSHARSTPGLLLRMAQAPARARVPRVRAAARPPWQILIRAIITTPPLVEHRSSSPSASWGRQDVGARTSRWADCARPSATRFNDTQRACVSEFAALRKAPPRSRQLWSCARAYCRLRRVPNTSCVKPHRADPVRP